MGSHAAADTQQDVIENAKSGTSYALYVDDIGSGTPGTRDEFAYFGLGGVIVNRSEEAAIRRLIRQFKGEWTIDEKTPLHGAEIRTMKDRFHWLSKLPKEDLVRFKTGIMELVMSMPIIVHGCIVDRERYYNRFYKTYERSTWNMRKSAAAILLERSVKFVRSVGGNSLSVYFELCGNAEDNIFKTAYTELRDQGHPFNKANAEKYAPLDATEAAGLLSEKPFGRKKDNELLQVADLCLFPLATSRNGKPNKAFERFMSDKKLVDTLVGDSTTWVKFYCFEP
jgi:hypothetical protein